MFINSDISPTPRYKYFVKIMFINTDVSFKSRYIYFVTMMSINTDISSNAYFEIMMLINIDIYLLTQVVMQISNNFVLEGEKILEYLCKNIGNLE